MLSLDVGCGHRSKDTKRGAIGIDRMRGKCDICADAHFLPFKNHAFGVVFLWGILEHLVNPNQCIKEVKRVSKKNALIYMSFPEITNMAKTYLKQSIFGFPFGSIVVLRGLVWRKRHPQYVKALGHKTMIRPQWVAKYLQIVFIHKLGNHVWFQGRKGKFLRKLGLKDRTRGGHWEIVAQT